VRRGLVLADRYELDQPIGRGGMGEVWRAYDKLLDRRLAVKFILVHESDMSDELTGRFEQEARSTAWLDHPGVPTVHDIGEHYDEGRGHSLYLVMQYVEGITLDHLIDAHETLPVPWVALIAAQVCAILSVAHERPLVHRDLKPSNLMLCGDGTVKILDFGVAVGLAPTDVRRTSTGVGAPFTPGYAAPEQMYGSPSPQSDLYSLGCVLYELLTGRQVFPANTVYEMMRRHEDDVPEPPRRLRPQIPVTLETLVLQLLAKQPADRPAGAREVYERVLDLVTDLEPLPGTVDLTAQPSRLARMYGSVQSRIRVTTKGAVTVTPKAAAAPKATAAQPPARSDRPHELPTLEEVAKARVEAADLAAEGRYTQAAELLSDLAEPARIALGDDSGVLALRLDLAAMLYEGGDYRRALPAYRAITIDLAEWYGPDDDKVLHCREHEAACAAQLGDTDEAIRLLSALLADVTQADPYDDLAFRVRERLGRLRLSSGQTVQAKQELSDLLTDLRTASDGHPQIAILEALLADIQT
jgi:serine/threonine protein kinase